jgi:hypothetical protein
LRQKGATEPGFPEREEKSLKNAVIEGVAFAAPALASTEHFRYKFGTIQERRNKRLFP